MQNICAIIFSEMSRNYRHSVDQLNLKFFNVFLPAFFSFIYALKIEFRVFTILTVFSSFKLFKN
jgi:hypothetical protein